MLKGPLHIYARFCKIVEIFLHIVIYDIFVSYNFFSTLNAQYYISKKHLKTFVVLL